MSANQSHWATLPTNRYLKFLLEKYGVTVGTTLHPNFVSCIFAHKRKNETLDPLWQALSDFVPDANFTLRYGMVRLIKCMIKSERLPERV